MPQKPAKVPTAADETSNVGKHEDDIIKGSRLAQTIKAQGGDPSDGKTDNVPKDDTISESRFARIMQGKRMMKRVEWPDGGVEVGIVVLTEEEIEESAVWASARMADAKVTLESLGTVNYTERLARESAIQVMWRATIDVETRRPFAIDPDEMRRLIPATVLDWLWMQYTEHQEDLSPFSAPMTEDEQDEAIEALKKGRWGRQLASCDTASLRTLCLHMASLLPD